MIEEWKVIKDYPDYQVSNLGRVKSFKKCRGINERILKVSKNTSGYLYVRLCKDKRVDTHRIHRLVLQTFKPIHTTERTVCNHIDGNKTNNYINNLEWCTSSENNKHAYRIGLKIDSEEKRKKLSKLHRGEGCYFCKLTERKVRMIRRLSQIGKTGKEIAKMFNVHLSTINRIISKKTWKHV